MKRLAGVLIATALVAGCASLRPHAVARPSDPATGSDRVDDLSSFIREVRALTQNARARRPVLQTIERRTPALSAALSALAVAPTPENLVAAGSAYQDAGVLDQALEHFRRAAALDPVNAAAWDGIARVWRDWRFPELGLPAASRAVFYAPDSPAAHNTRGTILQALGMGREARVEFERALALEADAAYAWNNICYSWVAEGDGRKASGACRAALALAPQLTPARNNLALAYAVADDLAGASDVFAAGGEAARAFNLGMVHLARGRFLEATAAFERAESLDPGMGAAAGRALQARRLAAMASAPPASTLDGEPPHGR